MKNNLSSKTVTLAQLAKVIDHSLLLPELTVEEAIAGCQTAKKYGCASVCIKPCYIELAVNELIGTDVIVGTVVGFPHGNSTTATKVFEAKDAIMRGATELDLVLNIGELCSGHDDLVREEIRQVVEAARGKAIVKVILENAYLTDEQKRTACRLCDEAGAHFVKTSTGFGFVRGSDGKFSYTGATAHDLKLMREHSAPSVKVKAAGGVRTLAVLLEYKELGISRCGATATAAMLDEAEKLFGEK